MHAAISLLALRPLHEIRLEHVAAHIGVSIEVVREEIPDMNGLLVAAIDEWNRQRMDQVRGSASRHGTVVFLRELLTISIADPTCMRMVMTAASVASSPDHPASEQLRQMWVRFHAIVQRALAQDITLGREPGTMDPASGAEQLLSIYEGLQLQWMFRPNMDLLAAYDRATSRLRHGWSETYIPAVWEI